MSEIQYGLLHTKSCSLQTQYLKYKCILIRNIVYIIRLTIIKHRVYLHFGAYTFQMGRNFPAANNIRLPMANPPAPSNHSQYLDQQFTAPVDRFFSKFMTRHNAARKDKLVPTM